jgi:hypothetical protein
MTLPGGAVSREASPSARSRGGVLQRVNRNEKESPGSRSVSGCCVFAAFFSALRPSGPFPLPLFTKYVEEEFSEGREGLGDERMGVESAGA